MIVEFFRIASQHVLLANCRTRTQKSRKWVPVRSQLAATMNVATFSQQQGQPTLHSVVSR
jgi:uncharacterized membrane protein (UPF0136 family)